MLPSSPFTVAAGVPTKRELIFREAAVQKAGQVGLGRAIGHLREQADLSQAELGRRAEMSGADLGAIERGDSDPKWGSLRRIARALSVELDDLLQLGIELAPGPAGDRLRRQEEEKRYFRGRAVDEGQGDEGQGDEGRGT